MKNSKIELLAPAGSADAFNAAIAAGADAVFFGLNRFNARKRAQNVQLTELESLCPLAKRHGVRTYLTLNTLLLDSELQAAVDIAQEAIAAGVDAIIVQDYGLLELLTVLYPQTDIHASTQLTTHNRAQCQLLIDFGCSQINLSRELSLKDLEPLCGFCRTNDCVAEVFVHGAFCISFSGQCCMSNALYGEAGNRGACVQPCRREFSVDSCEPQRFFNLKDNSGFTHAHELVAAGAQSFKIEGRIKGADYVWAVTSVWREQLDRLEKGLAPLADSPVLKAAFNRDLTDGYLVGKHSADMFLTAGKDQSLIDNGIVLSYSADSRELFVEGNTLAAGDKLSITESGGGFVCTGEIQHEIGLGKYRFQITNKLLGKIQRGQKVFKKPTLIENARLNAIIASVKPVERPLNMTVSGRAGEPLTVVFDAAGQSNTARSVSALSAAQNRALSAPILREQLGRLGGTGYFLDSLDITDLAPDLFLPLKELNEIRRNAMVPFMVKPEAPVKKAVPRLPISKSVQADFPVFRCDTMQQAESVLGHGAKVLFDIPLTPHKAVKEFVANHSNVYPAFSAILFETDFSYAESLLAVAASHAVYCENAGLALRAKQLGKSCILGPHLNCTNSWALQALAKRLNASAIVPSREISCSQVAALSVAQQTTLWYPLYEYEFLMQSRQCLVRSASGCPKNQTDRSCLETCRKDVLFKGAQNEKLRGVKRPGFYSALYKKKISSNYDALRTLNGIVEGWIVDLRSFSGQTQTSEELISIVDRASALVKSKNGPELFAEFSRRKFFLKP